MNSPNAEEDSSSSREKIENLKRKNKKKSKLDNRKKNEDKGSKNKSKGQEKSPEKNDNGFQQPMLSDVEVFSDGSPATDSSEYSSETRSRSDSVKLRKRTGTHKRMGNANWEGRMSRDFTEEMFKSVDLVDEMMKLRDGVGNRAAEEDDGMIKYEGVFRDENELLQEEESQSGTPAEEENGMKVENYLQQCENEDRGRKSDSKLDMENAADLENKGSRNEHRKVRPEEEENALTVEEYLQHCENEDRRSKSDFKMAKAANDGELTVEQYLKQYENELRRENNDSLQMTPKQSEDIDNKNDENIESFRFTSHEAKDENFEEDASDYLSVASYRYSSFESLDDAKIKREMSPNRQNSESKQKCDPSKVNNDGPFDVHTERKRRPVESEADRTEDEYLTAEERSVISVNESRNMSISSEVYLKERQFESEADRTEDEYLTADEQSVIWADDRRDDLFADYEDRVFYRELDDGSRKTSILANDDVLEDFKDPRSIMPTGETEAKFIEKRKLGHGDDNANGEGRFSVAGSRGDSVEIEDQVEEVDDDRNTIVGSDDAADGNLDFGEDDETGPRFEQTNQVLEDGEVKSDVNEESHSPNNEGTQNDDTEHKSNETEVTKQAEGSEKMRKRKMSFFSSMMVKKELKYAERVAGYDERYEIARKGIEDATRRFAEAKSNLPLMIVEQRVPKLENLERLNFKLKEMEKRLETVQIFNRRTNDYIQRWRTMDGKVQEKRVEVARFRRKTSEKQKLLMACKKRHGFLQSSIIRLEDLQQQSIRRITQLTDRLDMLKLRQTEQRNIVSRRIEQAKRSCEASVRAAARVVVSSKRVQMLKEKQRELEDKVVKTRREMKKLKKDTKEKEFDLERTVIQKSVKAMKKERGW